MKERVSSEYGLGDEQQSASETSDQMVSKTNNGAVVPMFFSGATALCF
jgi:hypothetical protein